ncbi:MAG: ABC transporter substrate-binding protein [Alphaproteobacteria bacterium]|nr:ABC transporter substrate-binding protein [Alphaproteobacteria bacterium]
MKHKAIAAAALLCMSAFAASAQTAPPAAVRDLAPSGKLKVAINVVNRVLAQEGAAGAQPSGITVDLARELGKRLGVAADLTVFRGAGTVFAAAKSGQWDVAFFAIEPVRAAEVDFTAPYVIIEGGYAVPKASPIKAVADVDKPGVRIAVGTGSAYDLFLTRTLKQAQLMRAPAAGGRYLELFEKEKLDVVAGVKPILAAWAKDRPDVRMLDGRFMEIEQAMGTPKGRGEAGRKYLAAFVEEMKKSGFVAEAMKRHGKTGEAIVAPPAK